MSVVLLSHRLYEDGMTVLEQGAQTVVADSSDLTNNLDLVKQAPFFTDVNDSRLSRVQQALRSLALVVADEPEVAAACTGSPIRPARGTLARVCSRLSTS